MIVVGITGASGSILGIRLVEELLNLGEEVTGIVSTSAWSVMAHELSFKPSGQEPLRELLLERGLTKSLDAYCEFDDKNLYAPVASGSARFKAVVVIPTSMKTLSAIANGYAGSLITRACDVALKENRQCILVPRETPLSLIHIENMRKATLAGASIAPPMPGFYTQPKTIQDVVNFTVGKILTLLGLEHTLFKSWGEEPSPFS
jgi:flavin prenyltransferase